MASTRTKEKVTAEETESLPKSEIKTLAPKQNKKDSLQTQPAKN